MNYVNHNKSSDSKMTFLNFLINPFFINFFIYIYFFKHIKMSKKLWAKSYHKDKERLQKKPHERHQNRSKEEKEEK